MNKLRTILAEYFKSSPQDMSYVRYFKYLNETGKITDRSLMECICIILTFLDEQESKNKQYEDNFVEIAQILNKLVNKRDAMVESQPKENVQTPSLDTKEFEPSGSLTCQLCKREFKSKLGLYSHSRTHLKDKK